MIRKKKVVTITGFIIFLVMNSFGQTTSDPEILIDYQRLDSSYVQILDTATGYWNIYKKKEFIYEKDSGIIYFIGSTWNSYDRSWVRDIKIVYTQDENGNLSHIVEYKRWETAHKWLENQKVDYIYDVNNKLSEKITYKWLNNYVLSEWRLYGKQVFLYENTQLAAEYVNIWDATDSTWQPSHKTEYTLNDEGNLINEKSFTWNENLNNWFTLPSEEYYYDSLGYTLLYKRGTGVFSVEGDFSYDINGNLLEYSEWSKSNEIDWRLLRLINFTYNTMYSIHKLLLPPGYLEMYEMNTHYKFTNKLTEILILDYTYNGYSTKETFFYSENNATSIRYSGNTKYRIFPNPAKDYVEIEKNCNDDVSLEIYDMQGRIILTKAVCHSEKLSLKYLPAGIYIYNFISDGEKQCGKLIKE
ncbi:T9SS type A sorting domain-containing protein [Saccharicrinis sp. FJH54]|uniref:T9SS type A sorting domain-containing protein n=1 Tax=Saccharicrinis sp. FJH54 TaxID=3344665 RepID=UPI0035D41471